MAREAARAPSHEAPCFHPLCASQVWRWRQVALLTRERADLYLPFEQHRAADPGPPGDGSPSHHGGSRAALPRGSRRGSGSRLPATVRGPSGQQAPGHTFHPQPVSRTVASLCPRRPGASAGTPVPRVACRGDESGRARARPGPSWATPGERGSPGSVLRGVPSPRAGRTRVPGRRVGSARRSASAPGVGSRGSSASSSRDRAPAAQSAPPKRLYGAGPGGRTPAERVGPGVQCTSRGGGGASPPGPTRPVLTCRAPARGAAGGGGAAPAAPAPR